ncbi:MAG TPA: hypothetical protein VJU79_06620 [Candidatus Dormibacteraeota bacterium]|nr:hypothetical protein [Candidatus Dormibacteraeota bacterium]
MRRVRTVVAAGVLAAAGLLPMTGGAVQKAAAASTTHHLNGKCQVSGLCAEVSESEDAFGEETYVGHDEPSALFYSNVPGSGNNVQYQIKLPREPSGTTIDKAGKSYTFMNDGSLWFGMVLCDTQSYPEQKSTCAPDSDGNILDPAISPRHSGEAFMEVQFYPPGWIPWPVWAKALGASSCDPVKWCAAVNIFSLAEDPVAGTLLNDTCAAKVGIEYWNFAFITLDGKSTGPANPVDSTLEGTFTPDPNRDLFMNQGDNVVMNIHDTPAGVQVSLHDRTIGKSGSMTASKANGFAQIKYTVNPDTTCTAIPYAFHPMYSTSSEKTRVTWAAHSYNVSFSDEIGHWEFCHGASQIPASEFALDANGAPIACPAGNFEGLSPNAEPTDQDDDFCFRGTRALLYKISGCTESNTGFDGYNYTPVWPDGNRTLHPTPFQFTSPLTGSDYTTQYSRVAFEADLPRVEGNTCDRTTGTGCTLIPTTDDNNPAEFYPFFSTTQTSNGCYFQFGNHIPGSLNDFGQNAQYGTLLNGTYTAFGGGGATITRYNNFRNILDNNPCPQG